MSSNCPLCGASKPEKSLFCEACSKKIESDYEVDLPDNDVEVAPVANQSDNTLVVEETSATPIPQPSEPEQPKTEAEPVKLMPRETVVLTSARTPKSHKVRNIFLFVIVAIALAIGGFYLYKKNVRGGNLERMAWDDAKHTNTVDGYIAYMSAYPNGEHYALADSMLHAIKDAENNQWSTLQTSDNTSALRDFLTKNPDSPYRPLARRRLDSLTWESAIQVNRADAFNDYLTAVLNGEFDGYYANEAKARYEFLAQSYPASEAEMDSIRQTVNGFFNALSSSNLHNARPYLTTNLERFYQSGMVNSSRIMGEMIMKKALSRAQKITYEPDLDALQYEKVPSGDFITNVPLVKTLADTLGNSERYAGYIVHMKLNPDYKISSVYESNPHNDVP